MKLRIYGDSLRLRLSRSDVERFRQTGVCTESLRFGPASQLTYTLETSSQLTADVEYREDCIRVLLPLKMAQEWAGSDQISVALDHSGHGGPSILIEKDFQCLHRDGSNRSDAEDAFPNPAADNEPARHN